MLIKTTGMNFMNNTIQNIAIEESILLAHYFFVSIIFLTHTTHARSLHKKFHISESGLSLYQRINRIFYLPLQPVFNE